MEDKESTKTRSTTNIKLSEFLAAFYLDENEPIHLRAFPPKGMTGRVKKLTFTRSQLTTDVRLQRQLRTKI